MELITGRLDAVVLDEVVARYYLNQAPGKYRILSEDFGIEDYAVGLRKEDTALMLRLDNTLANMRADGTTARIYTKWFGNTSK